MDFTLGVITGAFVVFALTVFYIAYIIEVKLDLPGILNNHVIHQHPVGLNDNQTKENILSEFSEISQARLRNMVESIIAEMLGTSGLTNVNVSEPELNTNTYGNGRSQLSHRHRTEHSFEPKAYQDFLAKAVLNKIADNEGYIRKLSESTPDLSSCNIDINFNMDDRSISPESSLETTSPFNYTDAQHSSKIIKDLDRESTINDYIASHTVPLPDLSTPMTDYEEDDMASVSSSILVEGNWEDNWLFRKKRPSLTTSITGSVGMLVPAPKDDVRAQIGDKTTDEISDLSEIDSDTDDSVQICAGLDPYNDRIVNKHLIGGQNTKVILDELIETASLISNTSHSPNEANYIETRNDHIVEKSLKTEAFNSKVANHSPLELKISSKSMPTSCYEAHTAQESENNPISDQLSSVTNLASRSTSTNIESCLAGHNNEQDIIHTNNCNNSFVNTTKLTNGSYPNSKSNFKQGQQFMYNNNSQEDNNGEEDDVVPLRHFVPGSIAEREYKKWNNAVEMPNNPYTPDALKRRISGSQERFIDLPNISSSTNKSVITVKAEDDEENESTSNIGYKRYSRDYYINADSTPKASPNHQNPRNDKRKRLCSGYSDELIEDTFTKEVNSYGKTSYKSIPLYSDESSCHWIFSTPVRRSNSLECINHRSPQKSCYNFTPNATSTAPTYYKVLPRQPSSFTSATHCNNLDRIHMSKINHRNDSYKYSNRIYNKTRANENENDIGRLDTNNKIDLDYCSDNKRSLRSWRSASVADNYSETLPSRRTLSSLSFYNNTNNTPLNSSNSKNLVLSNSNILAQFEKQLLHKDLKRNSFRAISVTTKDFVMNPLYESENTTTAFTDPNKDKSKLNLLTKGVSDDQTDSGVDSFMHCFVATNTNADNTSFLN
uniref:Uncharacterized protein n=1 Tax=Bactrocera dorsalis TaxID=27457 RepID=A0A034VWA5_BACDO